MINWKWKDFKQDGYHSGSKTPSNGNFPTCLDGFTQTETNFLIVDETWIHYYTTNQEEQLNPWVEAVGCVTKKAKTVPTARRVTSTVFGVTKEICWPIFFWKETWLIHDNSVTFWLS